MRLSPIWSVLIMVSCLSPACGDDDGSDDPAHDAAGEASGKSGAGGSGSSVGGTGGQRAPTGAGAGGSETEAGSGGNGQGADTDGGTSSGGDGLHEVKCTDEQFERLELFDVVNTSSTTDESNENGVIITHIDSTGGAPVNSTRVSQSYVYGRFTEAGFEQLEITDDDAFSSAEWDIAVRRYIIRLNSGVSGPSTVTGARTRANTTFDAVTSVPTDVAFRTEEYYTDSCEYVADTSGIGAPATALASFWSYPGCVSMTHNVYVLELANGKHVKLEVLSYYTVENQQTCEETGRVPMSASGAGNIRIKWAFID